MKLPVFDCVQCGYCCTRGVCPFGKWDDAKERCAYLTEKNLCEKYEEIIAAEKKLEQPFSPAMGHGCCSVLNETRRQKFIELGFIIGKTWEDWFNFYLTKMPEREG